MVEIIKADQEKHAELIHELFWEYLQWANGKLNEEYDVNFDIESTIEADMQSLEMFMPPEGCLLIGMVDALPVGIACLKYLSPGVGEIKRMYVRPGHRRLGLGRSLLNQLLDEAAEIGYQRVRLDSNRFMKQAHHLYKSVGFSEIDPYEGSEIPQEFQEHWIFMEMKLPG